jgi:phosphate transport system permease protein
MSTTYAADWPNDIEMTQPTPLVPGPSPDDPAHSAPPLPPGPAAPPDVPRQLNRRSIDDVASMVGSAVAALAFTWLVYERLLNFSGVVGFVLLTWVVFLCFYAGVTLLGNPRPVLWDRLSAAVMTSGAALVFGVVVWVIVFIFWRGRHAYVHPNFYTHDMSGVRPTAPLTQGGILHAIVGSAIQIGIAIAISLPLGIGTAIYLSEVGGRAARTVRTVVEAMTALPDILAGLFVYSFLIIALHWGQTGLTVAIALSVTMIPIIARSAEVVLRVVPHGLREAGLALGASRWRTVWNVVLPTARSGLVTSLILGTARIAGETAPLLIVSGATVYFNADPTSNHMNSLPLFIFTAVRSGEPRAIDRAYGAASVLLFLVIVLFATARYFARDRARSR